MLSPSASNTKVAASARKFRCEPLASRSGNSAASAMTISPRARGPIASHRARTLAALNLVRQRLAEQTGRTEDQHQDQHREDDDVGPLVGNVLRAERLHDADKKPAEHGSGEVSDAAQHRGGKRLESGGEPVEEP